MDKAKIRPPRIQIHLELPGELCTLEARGAAAEMTTQHLEVALANWGARRPSQTPTTQGKLSPCQSSHPNLSPEEPIEPPEHIHCYEGTSPPTQIPDGEYGPREETCQHSQ